MSQSSMARLESEDGEFLLVSNDSSLVPQRRLKRLKRVALVSTQEQYLDLERNDGKSTVFEPELVKRPWLGLEGIHSNEFASSDQERSNNSQGLNKKEDGGAQEQSSTPGDSPNLLDKVQEEGHGAKGNTEGDEVVKDHGERESGGGKKSLRKSHGTEEIKGKKKMRKSSGTAKERVADTTEELHIRKGGADPSQSEKKKRRKSSNDKSKPSSTLSDKEIDIRKGGADPSQLEKKKRRKSSHDKSKPSSTLSDKEIDIRKGGADPSQSEKKMRRKSSHDKSKPSSEAATSASGQKGRKKKKKAELEELHAESQRLLRETRDASFKPQSAVGKSISSVLEKIRLRKFQLDQKAGKGLTGMSKTSGDYETNSGNLSDDSDHSEFEDCIEDKDEILQEDHCMENEEDDSGVNFTTPPANDSAIPRTPENNIETSLYEKVPKQDVSKINGGLRAPVEDTQDLFCNSQLSYGEDEENPVDRTQEEEVLAPAMLNMNLNLDSHPQEDELSDEDDNKENVDPLPSKPVGVPVYRKGAPVKAFVDDEAEDEDEDILVGQDEEDASDDDGNEDLQDIIATAEEEHPIDHEKRDELHRKWLEQQDADATGDILLRLRSGWKPRDPRARRASFLDEEDDVDFDSQEDDIVEGDDEPVYHNPVPKIGRQGDDDSKVENLPEKTAVDEDDGLETSDDEELEQRLLRQRILEESEEQEVFMRPAEDESSREVFGLIKKVNIAAISKKKTKPASTFLETLCGGGNSNGSSKSSFLGRAASSSLQLSHKQGLSGSKSFIFGRDDSNSRHSISKAESQEDMLQDQKENEHFTDTSRKGFSTEAKAKKGESANKKTNNANDTFSGPSLFEILRRQTSQTDRTLQSRNTNTLQEYREIHTISHFAAFKSLKATRTFKKAG